MKKEDMIVNMKQCADGGHYYDASIHNECPYCGGGYGATTPLDGGRTMPLGGAAPPPNIPAAASAASPADNRTRPLSAGVGDIGRTVAIVKEELGIDPVVGWLICLDGKEKGRDYRIHTDNNYIGRGEKMDICIRGDDTISRENHAVISYDAREKLFYFTPGDGRSIVRLNDKGLFSTTEIKAHDIVEIGKTKLVFLPLCGENFEWV